MCWIQMRKTGHKFVDPMVDGHSGMKKAALPAFEWVITA
jgi:hypothetical protein